MFKNIFIVTLACIFGIGFFEFFLKYSPYEYGVTPVEYDKEIGTWHKKNYEGYAIRECYKVKYIFDENGLPKNIFMHDENKKDVILLGDSYVEAIMIKNENIVHNALARESQQKYNFLNYGLSDTSPVQQLIILQKKVNLDHTNYVLQFIGLENDLEEVVYKKNQLLRRPKVYIEFKNIEAYKIIEPRERKFTDIIGDLLSKYQLYFFIKRVIKYLKKNVLPAKDKLNNKQENMNKNWVYLKGTIYQTNKYLKSINKNIEYKIIISSKNNENKKKIKMFLEKEHIKYMFLEDVAKNLNIKLTSFTCDRHWDDNTHKNIAKIIIRTGFIK